MVGFDIIEGQPHNNVHNNVGGFMGDFLSPVDPIFFMHHSNIDRLWDVWTRKQQELGLPTLPTGADLAAWKKEPFLFYIDAAGKPVQKNTAGDYATIGDFNYDYQPGSGEQVISTSVKPSEFSNKLFEGTLSSKTLNFQQSTQGGVQVPEALRDAIMEPTGPRLFARITIQPPANTRGVQFHVVVNPPEGAQNVTLQNPSYAGTFEFFGSHQHGDHTDKQVTFVVGLTETVKKLRETNMLKTNEALKVHVVPGRRGVTLTPFEVALSSISVGAF
jgi:tyrosinase